MPGNPGYGVMKSTTQKVWDTPNPKKASAKAAAKKAGRPYPNLVDNMRAAKGK